MTVPALAASPRAMFVADKRNVRSSVKKIVHGNRYSGPALFILSWMAVTGTAAWASGKADQEFDFKIPRLPLDKALTRFTAASKVGNQYYGTGVQSLIFTNPVKGRYRARDAASIMLENTGVTYNFVQDGNLLHVTLPARPPQQVPQRASERAAMPQAHILGSRLANGDRAGGDVTPPSFGISGKQIEASFYSTLEGFLANEFTGHAKAPIVTGAGLVFRPFDQLSIFGLGPSCTAVTVNGRRGAGISANGIVQQRELALYPVWDVERIEVVPGPSSLLRGPGGICGHVNIQLKQDQKGTVLNADWGRVDGTRAGSGQISGKKVFDIERWHGTVSIVAGVGHEDGIQAHEQNTLTSGREAAARNNPALAEQALPPLGGRGKNIRSAANVPLLKNGKCSFLNIPENWDGAMDVLLERDCQYDFSLADSAQDWGGAKAMLRPSTDRAYVNLRGRFHPTPNLTFGIEGGYLHSVHQGVINVVDSTMGRASQFLAADPRNPFGQEVLVVAASSLGDGLMKSELSTKNLFGTTNYHFEDGSSLSIEHGQSRAWIRTNQPYLRPDSKAASASTETGWLERQMPYVLDSERSPVAVTEAQETSLLYTRSAFRSAGGNADLAMIATHRREELEDANWLLSWSGNMAGAGDAAIPERSQTTYSLYTRLGVPLLAPHDESSNQPRLEAQVSLRGDLTRVSMPPGGDATREFDAVAGEASVEWWPLAWLLLRGSFSRGVQPPPLALLADPIEQVVPSLPILDPLTGRQLGPLTLLTGGNRDLRAEHSKAWRGGFRLAFRNGSLYFAADYIQIVRSDVVLTSDDLLFRDPPGYMRAFESRFRRALNADGTPGEIDLVDTSSINMARQDVRAVELAAGWRVDLDSGGTLDLMGSATHLPKFLSRAAPGALERNLAGLGNRVPPEWRAVLRAVYGNDRWQFGWTGRFTSSTRVSDDPRVVASQGRGGKVSAQLYHDIFMKYSTQFHRTDLTFRLDGHNVLKTPGAYDAAEAYYTSRYSESERPSVRASVTAAF
jgi:outer membrane receptor protein involved in Fe transport